MIPTQRAEIVKALSDLFVLKGETKFSLEELIMPVALTADLTESPYLRYAIPVGRGVNIGAVAARFGYQLFRPGANKVLQVKQIIIHNSDVAAQTFNVRIGTAAFVAQLDTIIGTNQLQDLSSNVANSRVSSIQQNASDVAGTDTGSSSLFTVALPATSSQIITFPFPGISLFGSDEGGVPALAVKCETLNIGFGSGVFGREWPLPGV